MAEALLSPAAYRLLVEHSPVLIWRAGPDGRCDYFNDTWLRFTGRTLDQELGERWAVGVHPEDVDRCLRIYRDHFGRREPFEMEYRLRRHDGVYRWIFDRGVPVFDAGVFVGFVGSCIDIHVRREAEALRSSFLSLIAHELRTPLQAIHTYLEVVQRRIERNEALPTDVWEKVSRQIQRFSSLVDDLSEAGRVERREAVPVERVAMDLRPVVEAAVRRQRDELAALPAAAAGRHTVTLEVTGERFPLLGDAERLDRVLEDLIGNAVKFSPAGGQVAVRLATDGTRHRVSIRDDGIGIPQAEIDRVAEPFFRGSNALNPRFPGVGLGLALARDIVSAHGGTVEVESIRDRGTTITLNLPELLPEGVS
ncbi:MAG TPA: PAS domain-containing sensor histidine kinase [Thermoanaerobaculia bacterium]|nr:PAS domain-containing sensor histidine kinase [Thermoanaerobaculia bacterium]